MVSRNLKSKYGRSLFGVGWTVLSPVLLACMYYFVFKKIIKINTPYYLSYIIAGMLPWSFFSLSVMDSMDALVLNHELLTKIPLPLNVMAYVMNATHFVTLLAGFPVMCCVSFLEAGFWGWQNLFAFYFFICLLLISYPIGLFLSIIFVFFRDLKHLIGLLLQLWMFATPILYPVSMLTEKHRFWLHFNPLADIMEGLHVIFAQGRVPSLEVFWYAASWAFLFTIGGQFCLQRQFVKVVERL